MTKIRLVIQQPPYNEGPQQLHINFTNTKCIFIYPSSDDVRYIPTCLYQALWSSESQNMVIKGKAKSTIPSLCSQVILSWGLQKGLWLIFTSIRTDEQENIVLKKHFFSNSEGNIFYFRVILEYSAN